MTTPRQTDWKPLGRLGHLPDSLKSDEDFRVYDKNSGDSVCHVLGAGNSSVTEWDAFFIASALNHVIHGDSHDCVTSDAHRSQLWSRFLEEFPLGFELNPPEHDLATGIFRLGLRDSESGIDICLQHSRGPQDTLVRLIHGASIQFYELLCGCGAHRQATFASPNG